MCIIWPADFTLDVNAQLVNDISDREVNQTAKVNGQAKSNEG